jgi:SulP family sulfate permease
VFGLVYLLEIDTKTVGDIAPIQGDFPWPSIPQVPFTLEMLKNIFPYALIMAGVGLIESLLTLNIIDEITETRGRGNKEAVAQGAANILSGFTGGMGGCAMIGQSLINISSGARARLSGIVAAVMLLVFIMFGAGLIEQLPMAALTGIMIMVSIGTFEWASLRTFGKMPKWDLFVLVLVTLITVFLHNLALAVLIGVVIAALVFAYENAKRIRARKHIDANGVKHYEIYGPLFFGSVQVFSEKFDPLNDPEEVIIDFMESRVVDMSAIEALNRITERYAKLGKKVHLRHLSPDCRKRLNKAEEIIEVNVDEDPTYKVMADFQ